MYARVGTHARIYRFGGFEADQETGQLHRDGRRIPLQALPFELLISLLEHPGSVLTREDLRERIWPEGVNLDFDAALATALRKLRQALGDSSKEPRYVETLPGRGYRYVGPVEAVPEEPPPAGKETVSDSSGPDPARKVGRYRSLRSLVGGLLAGGALLVGTGGWWSTCRPQDPSTPGPVVLVLPSRLLGLETREVYLSESVAETLTSMLGRARGVETKVPPTALQAERFKGDLSRIARAYTADRVVVSSLAVDGKNLALSVRLVDAPSQKVLWGGQFTGSRDAYLDLVREAAQGLAAALVPSEENQARIVPPSHDSHAELALREGRYLVERFHLTDPARLELGIQALRRAQSLSPGSPVTMAELAWALIYKKPNPWNTASLAEAEDCAERALAKDPRCALAWAALSLAELNRRSPRPDRIAAWAVKALELNPQDPRVHETIGSTSPTFAIQAATGIHLIELEPLNMTGYGWAALGLVFTGRNAEALPILDRALVLEDDGFCRWLRFEALARAGRIEEAKRAWAPGWWAKARMKELEGDLEGARREVQQAFCELRTQTPSGFQRILRVLYSAPMLTRLGMREEALWLMEDAAQAGAILPYDWIVEDPDLAPLHEDPRYRRLLDLSRGFARQFHQCMNLAQQHGALPRYLQQPFHGLGAALERSGGPPEPDRRPGPTPHP